MMRRWGANCGGQVGGLPSYLYVGRETSVESGTLRWTRSDSGSERGNVARQNWEGCLSPCATCALNLPDFRVMLH